MSRKLILLVDDDRDTLEAYASLFQALGHSTASAADNAVQTLEPHRRRTFELPTLDRPSLEFDTHDGALAWLLPTSLVAVTVNESWVPGAGISWPVFGCR